MTRCTSPSRAPCLAAPRRRLEVLAGRRAAAAAAAAAVNPPLLPVLQPELAFSVATYTMVPMYCLLAFAPRSRLVRPEPLAAQMHGHGRALGVTFAVDTRIVGRNRGGWQAGRLHALPRRRPHRRRPCYMAPRYRWHLRLRTRCWRGRPRRTEDLPPCSVCWPQRSRCQTPGLWRLCSSTRHWQRWRGFTCCCWTSWLPGESGRRAPPAQPAECHRLTGCGARPGAHARTPRATPARPHTTRLPSARAPCRLLPLCCAALHCARRTVILDGLRQVVPTWHSVLLCFMVGPLGVLSHLVTRLVVHRARGDSAAVARSSMWA